MIMQPSLIIPYSSIIITSIWKSYSNFNKTHYSLKPANTDTPQIFLLIPHVPWHNISILKQIVWVHMHMHGTPLRKVNVIYQVKLKTLPHNTIKDRLSSARLPFHSMTFHFQWNRLSYSCILPPPVPSCLDCLAHHILPYRFMFWHPPAIKAWWKEETEEGGWE